MRRGRGARRASEQRQAKAQRIGARTAQCHTDRQLPPPASLAANPSAAGFARAAPGWRGVDRRAATAPARVAGPRSPQATRVARPGPRGLAAAAGGRLRHGPSAAPAGRARRSDRRSPPREARRAAPAFPRRAVRASPAGPRARAPPPRLPGGGRQPSRAGPPTGERERHGSSPRERSPAPAGSRSERGAIGADRLDPAPRRAPGPIASRARCSTLSRLPPHSPPRPAA